MISDGSKCHKINNLHFRKLILQQSVSFGKSIKIESPSITYNH